MEGDYPQPVTMLRGKLCGSAPEFDLRRTLESGQVFHAMSDGEGWQILVDRTPLYAEQHRLRFCVQIA